MDTNTDQLVAYIRQSLQLGSTPDEVSSQLQAAGWPIDTIHQAFSAVQNQMAPSTMHTPATSETHTPQAIGKRRGRIRTGWVLFKTTMQLLNTNRYLMRYLLMTWVVIIIANAILFGVIWFGYHWFVNEAGDDTLLWYALVFVAYIVTYFLINFYAAALARNILDIFQGVRQPYKTYIGAARAKAWPIFMFSVIESIVGIILRYVVERIRFVGWIIAWLLGTAWSIGTMFVLPLIMDGDVSATRAIKQSIGFFKQTWGENVVSKVTVNAPLALLTFLLYLVAIPVIFVAVMSGNYALMMAVIIVYLILQISLAILGSFANSTLNTALYYYAVHHQVPTAFSGDMLDRVFIQRKHFRKK
jgi:hypothetical protein